MVHRHGMAKSKEAEEVKFVFQTKALAAPPTRAPKPSAPFYFATPPDTDADLRSGDTLPECGRAYFHQMLTQYWTYPTNEDDPAACVHFNLQAIGVIYGLVQKYQNNTLTWEDVYEMETAHLRVMPEAVLRSQAWTFRARYQEIAPAAHYQKYAQSKVATEQDCALPTETLRAELETLLGEMQKYRTFAPSLSKNQTSASTNAFAAALTLLTAGAVFLILRFLPLPSWAALLWTLIPILASGALGGLLSLQSRHRSWVTQTMAHLNASRVRPLEFHRASALLSGAFFAALLFFGFRSHALQGIIFPRADRAALSYPLVFAVLLAWSFCAGFAECLTPRFFDFLQRRLPKAAGEQP